MNQAKRGYFSCRSTELKLQFFFCFFYWVIYFTHKSGWQQCWVKGKLKACGEGIELSISISWNNLKKGLRAAHGAMRQRWEVTGRLTEVHVWTEDKKEVKGEGQAIRDGPVLYKSIQSYLPLLLSRLGYTMSLLHFLQQIILYSSGWDSLKSTEGDFFGIEKGRKYLKVYYSVVLTINSLSFMLCLDNFSLGGNQNFGNKLKESELWWWDT